jgi:hypothetical protein
MTLLDRASRFVLRRKNLPAYTRPDALTAHPFLRPPHRLAALLETRGIR